MVALQEREDDQRSYEQRLQDFMFPPASLSEPDGTQDVPVASANSNLVLTMFYRLGKTAHRLCCIYISEHRLRIQLGCRIRIQKQIKSAWTYKIKLRSVENGMK